MLDDFIEIANAIAIVPTLSKVCVVLFLLCVRVERSSITGCLILFNMIFYFYFYFICIQCRARIMD